MAIDKKKIEETGVNFVGSAFNRAPRVLAHFYTNDKTVCIDGNVEVYSSDTLSKSNLEGIIDVQIKSTLRKPGQAKHPKYSLSTVDLEKYRDVYGGVILFVAFLHADLSLRSIYYKALLPYDIQMILGKTKDEKSKSATFRLNRLPQNPDAIRRLCQEFLVDKKKQAISGSIGIKSYDDWRFEGISFEAVELSKVYLPGESPFALSAFENGAYVYGTLDSGIQVPIDKIENLTSMSICSVGLIEAGKFREEVRVAIGEDEKGDFIVFPGFKLRRGEPGRIEYEDRGTFSERFAAAKILLGLFETGELSINGHTLRTTDKIAEKDIEDAKNRIGFYREIEELRRLLDIKVDWDPDSLSDSDVYQIRLLVRGFVRKEKIRLTCSEDSCVNMNCDVDGARIKAIAIRDENGEYRLLNPLSPDIMLVIGSTEEEIENGKESPVPSMFMMSGEDLRLAGNLDINRFQESLARFPIVKENSGQACDRLLAMLSSFDENPICPNELIGCAQILSDALLELEPGNERYIINRFQCIRRSRPLTSEEKKEIRSLMLVSDDQQIRVAASALLGEKESTELLFSMLDDDKKQAYLSWPISNLSDYLS